MRSTWVFEDASTLHTLTGLAFLPGSTLPAGTPRSTTWSTSGMGLSRARTCGGSENFMNDYSVVVSSSGTELRLVQGALMLTYRLRG